MPNDLMLAKSVDFNGLTADCYSENGELWMARKQIGTLLGYSHPSTSVSKIHRDNKERLDKFSMQVRPYGSRPVTLYNFKGLLEICRLSRKPKANQIIDWVYSMIPTDHMKGDKP